MAFSAWLVRWSLGGRSWKSMLLALKKLEGLGALVVNAEGRGLEATVYEVLSEACLCSH